MDWTTVGKPPDSIEVKEFIQGHLRSIYRGDIIDFLEFLKEFCKGQRVLDIGCVDHDFSHIEHPNWKHRMIKEVANEVIGIDINEEMVSFLNSKGYKVLNVDATSNKYIGGKFDVVFMGDVIEHVDNPVALLKFGKRHLTENGAIIVATPNPIYFRNIIQIVKYKTILPNAEHLSWITPSMALEISRRSDTKLYKYYTSFGSSVNFFKKHLKIKLKNIGGELFTEHFYFLFKDK